MDVCFVRLRHWEQLGLFYNDACAECFVQVIRLREAFLNLRFILFSIPRNLRAVNITTVPRIENVIKCETQYDRS